ncbi:MAG: ArsR family transcriptional regulator [Alphaproteobacteria bacterium]|nr:MAG: ArsR family transcriptional regulator [Alphaproteobacteria bacterium]
MERGFMDKTSKDIKALPPIENRVSFLIHRVNAQLARLCNPFFARYKLDLFSSRILVALLEKREMRVGELVDLMALPQSTISHQLRRLETQGLIERNRRADDNRSVTVNLSKDGERVASECNALSAVIYDALVDKIPATDLDVLERHLSGMYARLKQFDPAALEYPDDSRS